MENRPHGRRKNVSGQGGGVNRRGSGLNLGGPVGKSDGYSARRNQRTGSNPSPTGGSSPVRAGSGGIGCTTVVIILIVLFFLMRGGGGSDMLSGVGDILNSGTQNTATDSLNSIFSSLGSMPSFGSYGSSSSGWSETANTGKLNTSVADGARAKRTTILGGGRDVVTIMVYMCGTDLESKNGMATSDLQEMMRASLSPNVNLLVYTGGCKQWQNNVVSNRSNQIYKIENGSLKCLVQSDAATVMTKPATLTGFINYCTKNYPANRYDLIFWDHGGGSINGFGYDEKNPAAGAMSLTGINEALKASNTTFDFIGFDACLMSTLENALMLGDYADYLIASEETEPGVGWYYTNWLGELSNNTSMPTIELGKKIIDDFVSACDRQCSGQKTTLSMVDLAELSATVPSAFKDFASSTATLLSNDGYQTVSNARAGTREFAASNRIDQVDLVHLASNMNTDEGNELKDALLGAVKYNRTSSNMTNAYGLSIYFPYNKVSNVKNAVATYQAIGVDDEYSRCIQQFASLETGGQAVAGNANDMFSVLFGNSGASSQGSSYSSGADSLSSVVSILGTLMGGSSGSSADLTSLAGSFFGRSIDMDAAAQYLYDNRFDTDALTWRGGVIALSEEQWAMVHDLQLNVFYDDGEGYIDLGLDNVFDFDEDGALIGEYDGTWVAIDGQIVPYYYVDSTYDGSAWVTSGRVPVMINGDRAELMIVFVDGDDGSSDAYIAGARTDYVNGETETVAKGQIVLSRGDVIDFICDYYDYDGNFQNNYLFGEQLIYTGDHEITNAYLPDAGNAVASYMFTDMYNKEYWTPEIR